MQTKTKRAVSWLSMLAVIAMLATLIGCNSQPANTSDPTQSDESTASSEPMDVDSEPDGPAAVDSSTPDDVTDPDSTAVEPGDTTAVTPTDAAGTTAAGGKTTTGKTTNSATKKADNGLIKTKATTTKGTTEKVTTRTTAKPGSTDDIFAKIPTDLSKTKTIKVLVWWGVDDKGDDARKAKLFQEKTGYKVAYETASLTNYQTRLSSMVMSNSAPHCAAIINEWYPQPITRGLMQPLDVTGWNFKDDVYATALMDQFSYKGKYYGMALKGSYMTTFYCMFWNKNLLKQAGVTETPDRLFKAGKWNWDTCLEIAKKTTNAAKGQYGLTITYQNYWMLSAGQDFVLADKNGLVNNIKSTKLLDAWYHSWDMIYTNKVVDTSFTDVKPFYAGTAAMFGGGSFAMQKKYVPENMKDDWGVVPFPSPAGMSPVSACEGTVFGFPTRIKGDELKKAAWYLRFYLDDKNYGSSDIYTKDECYDLMDWFWKQNKIQSFNSVGVLTYGGEYTPSSVQYSLTDQADSKAKVKSNLDTWYGVFDANIKSIETEMG